MISSVFLGLVLLIAGMDQANILGDVVVNNKACAEENNIAVEEIISVRKTADKYSIQASDDLKCFSRCVMQRNLITDDGVNLERHVELSIAMGRNEAKTRSNFEECKSLKTANITCAESWNLYACMQKQ